MAEVNEALIRKVAELARLDLKDQEIQDYVKSIGDILKHVDQLTSIKVDDGGKEVEPMYHGVDHGLRFREDKIVEFPTDDNGEPKVLKNAPEILHGGYKVPQIL